MFRRVAPVFCSDGLPAEHGVAGDPFRFVAGDLRVAGNLYLSGQLLVAGNVVVDGVIDSGDWHALLVLGDVDCRALDCSESYALIEGSLRAKELVLVDDGAIVRVGGELVSPALISGELGAGETSVAGAPRECDLDLNEPARHALFVDGVVGPEDAVFSWHLMRALRRGQPVWRVKQTQFTDSSSS